MRIVDLGLVYFCAYNFFDSEPKFTNLFLLTPWGLLSINFVSNFRYLNRFLKYMRSKLEVS